MHRPRSQVAEELAACIRCNQCLVACPALGAPIPIEKLNRETLDGSISASVMRFAQNCYLCGACVPVCPVGLHRNTMMLWLKMRLLRSHQQSEDDVLPSADDGGYYEYAESYRDGYDDEEDDYYAPRPRDAANPRAWTAHGWSDE